MNKHTFKLTGAFATLGAMLLTACSQNDIIDSYEADDNAPYLELIRVDLADYGDTGEEEGDDEPENKVENPLTHTDAEEASALLLDDFRTKEDGNQSVLYFSQLVSGKLVPFETAYDKIPSSISERYPDSYPNLYSYKYDLKYSVTWEDDPGGYNFFPDNLEGKMDWDVVKAWGLNNTGYALFGLYYPYNNILPTNELGQLDFMVQRDQTTKENLRKSNYIGAYHSSSKSGQRLKFRLYHLTSYIKVTLYVPVFNPHDIIINDQGKEEEVRSGYPADALLSAEVRDVINHFRINWYAGRSSDTAPLTVTADNDRGDVLMYIPQPEDYPDTDGLPPKVTIRLADYIRDAASDKDLPETDECWKITLSALIPAGQDYPIDDPKYPMGQTWTDLNFLRFNLRQNIGDVPKRYVFTGNSAYGLIGSGDALNISQGRLQHLSLYLPRYGDKAVLLGANVVDWEQWYNDNMGLRQEEPENPETPDTPTDPGTTDDNN